MDLFEWQAILGTSSPCSAMILWTLVSLREHMLESQGAYLVGMALHKVMMVWASIMGMAQETIATGTAASTPRKAVPFRKSHLQILEKKRKKIRWKSCNLKRKTSLLWIQKLANRISHADLLGPLLECGENPPSAKQPSKMLVTKKVSKEDPAAAFSAAFTRISSCKWKQIVNHGSKCL